MAANAAMRTEGTEVKRARRTESLFVLPAVLYLGLFYLVPLVQLVLTSLDSPELSLRHYRAFFTSPAYLRVLWQTIRVSLEVTGVSLLLGYPTALFLSRLPVRTARWLLLLVAGPYLTSFLVRTYAWVILLSDQGVIHTVLSSSGLVSEPPKLLYNAIGVHIGMVHVMLPLMVLPLYSVMRGIDDRLMKAARSLGASSFTAFLRVFLPLTQPGVRSGCLLVFVLSLGFFITPVLLGGMRDLMLSTVIDAYVTSGLDFAFAAAVGIVLLAASVAAFPLLVRNLDGTRTFAARPSADSEGETSAASAPGRSREPAPPGFFDRFAAAFRARRWASRQARTPGYATPAIRPADLAGAAVLSFLTVPSLIVVVMSFGDSPFLEFPPARWSLRWYHEFLTDESWRGAALSSLEIAAATSAVATVLGSLAAYGLIRGAVPGRTWVLSLLLSPLVVPSIVLGLTLYRTFVWLGLIGTATGLVIAHSLAAIPYVVVVVSAALAGFDFTLERAARSLGARWPTVLLRVTFPVIRPAVLTGALFAFIHSFDEIVVTLLVAGVMNRTLPLKMWESIRHEVDPRLTAVASILIVLPFLSLMLLELNRRVTEARERPAGPA